MSTKRESMSWAGAVALLGLVGTMSACGTEGDAPAPEPTASTSSELLSNVAYVPWQTLLAKGSTAVDATLFNGKAYFAYVRSSDSNIGIIIESNLSSNGQSAATYAIPQKPQFGVALLALNNTLYMFYSIGGLPMMQRSTDGLNWDGPFDIGDEADNGIWSLSGPPSAVAWDGVAVAYYPEAQRGGPSYIVSFGVAPGSTTGSAYYPWWPGNIYTNLRPTATVWQGKLYLAWADAQNGGQIGIQHFQDRVGWSSETLTGKTGTPAIYPVGAGGMEMVYRGTDSYVYSTFSGDGVTFGASSKDPKSTTGHAVIPFENWNLSANWVFFMGVDNKLYTALE
jgi:hypothetical protein